MSSFGDYPHEMPRNQPFDDDAFEAILAGTSRDDRLADLAAFVSDVRMSAAAAPNPSPALAAALATGFSTDKVAEPPKWGMLRMKIQGLLAGLGVAGKVALGASLAAAATTGAGAAGILPGPVQHVVAATVGSVTPFHFPGDDQGQSGSGSGEGAGTTTTLPSASPTTVHEPSSTDETSTTIGETPAVPGAHAGDGNGGVTPPHQGDTNPGGAVTPTTEHHGDASSGPGDGTEPTTTPTTPNTEHHGDGNGGGDSNNPQSLWIECTHAQNPDRITCQWTASTSSDHAKYVLLRITSLSDKGVVVMQSDDALDAADTSVTAGVGYGYRVISLRADGSVESHSNVATIMCCGDAGTTTTTTPHESTTTTTEHHEATTTTTRH